MSTWGSFWVDPILTGVDDRNLSLSRVGLYDYCTTMESSSMTQKKIPVISKSLALCYIAVVDDYFDVS